MELWQEMLRASVDSGKDLVERFNFDKDLADKLNSLFHIRINPYLSQPHPVSGRSYLAAMYSRCPGISARRFSA